jgi:hypothetical protein
MGNHILKSIRKIAEDNDVNSVAIFTNHLKIEGEIFIPEGRCEECLEDYITLKNAEVCRISDYCNCDDENCECNDTLCCQYKWLNLNTKHIVAFSVIKK